MYPETQIDEMRDALGTTGYWYEDVFGEAGDSGIVDPDWGLSAFTPEWLAKAAAPGWRIVEHASGRNEGSQDVYVLERADVVRPDDSAEPVRQSVSTR
jgi:hypothetical protein